MSSIQRFSLPEIFPLISPLEQVLPRSFIRRLIAYGLLLYAERMNRRQFLRYSWTFTGYSLLVCCPKEWAAEAQKSQRFVPSFFQHITSSSSPGSKHLACDPHLPVVDLHCDVLIAGGGMAGVCAALAAARHGARVVLVQDRSRLGGNASSEVKMHIVGANCHGARPGWREGGLIEELRLEDAVRNPQWSFEMWDLLLYDKLIREPNITLLLDTVLYAAEVREGRIQQALARCDKTEQIYRVHAKIYIDCTGDSRLALEAGAETMWGREGRDQFGESLAPEKPDKKTMGSSILFTARDYGRPMPFQPPPWARKITPDMLRFRHPRPWEYGYWWIEWGGERNTIRDNERIRFELLSIVLGVWDYIKNSGTFPEAKTWAIDWIGMIPGKRESRRIVGEKILTQHDLEGRNGEPYDAVAIGGWPMDDHPPGGFDAWDQRPTRSVPVPEPYNIPLRCLYSRNIKNLMMAGRNISASHVAFSSTRVMATCSVIGQAVGTAAALCVHEGLLPRELAHDRDRVRHLQQLLLRDDQTIKGLRNEDPLDLARRARVTASDSHPPSRPENIINGLVRDMPGEWKNRWAAKMRPGGVWIQLEWDPPVRLSWIQITWDSGFHRELTLSASKAVQRRVIRGPQPETVRDYQILWRPTRNARWQSLVQVQGNYQRLVRHRFAPIQAQAIRIHITATNGSPLARVYEVRAYET